MIAPELENSASLADSPPSPDDVGVQVPRGGADGGRPRRDRWRGVAAAGNGGPAGAVRARRSHNADRGRVARRPRRLAREQAALRRVAELVARGAALAEVFDAAAAEASRLLDGVVTDLFRFDDGVATVVAARSCVGGSEHADRRGHGHRPATTGRRPAAAVHDGRDRSSRRGPRARHRGRRRCACHRGGAGVGRADLQHARRSAAGRHRKPAGRVRRARAAAIANAENKAKLRASRARVVATADEARQRLQRDVARRRPAAARPDGARAEARSGRGGPGGGPGRPRAGGARARRARDGGAARPRPRDPPGCAEPWRSSCRHRLSDRATRTARRPGRHRSATWTAAERDRGQRLLRGRRGVDERGQARTGDRGPGNRQRGGRHGW